MSERDVFVVSAVRTAIGTFGGSLKDVAPSSDLRKWFGHRADRWGEFADRYRRELADNEAFSELRRLAADRDLTLVYAAHDPKHNHALVLLNELVDALG